MSDPSHDPTTLADPYARLGLRPGASESEIKRAYRKLAREHHPDRNPGDPDAERRFRAIAAAYEVLSDPTLRARHEAERGRTGASEEFLADFTDALERAERIVFSQVLPRYGGTTAEQLTRLARDYWTSAVLGRLNGPAPRPWRRLWGWRQARRMPVHVDYQARPHAVADVWRTGGGWVIVLYPGAFWARGVREPVDLDDAVLTVLLGRVLAILASEARVDLHGVDGDRWEVVLSRAQARDSALRRARLGQIALWTGLAALSALMWYSAWSSR